MAVSRTNRRLILGFSSALVALALYLALGATPTDAHAGHDHASVNDALAASGSCESMGMVTVGELGLCTHGPDPAPPGVTAAVVDRPVDFATAGAAVCAGDGTSGKRVQVIYARASDRADRYSTYLPSMRTWASQADTVYQASAQETGGQRYIRFVHDANCVISVANVTLSTTGDDNFNSMISELYDQGYSRNDRRYLVYLDSNSSYLCGQGTVWQDDSPGLSNDNNTYYGYAAIYNGCWSDGTTTAHELGHTFGAVQSSAPHYSGYGHCTDEWDVMCYVDGPGVSMTINCADTNHDARLDCNHDDYFHTNPPSGNYLATHWNIANSGFLGKSLSTLTLSKTQSKYNGEIVATMGGFSPNATITLRWPDGTVLAQTTSDGAGNGTATFRTPLAPLGNYTVRALDASGRSATTVLRVIPRIKLTASSGLAGSTIRVYFYGFSPGDRVQIQWFTTSGPSYQVLKTVTVASNGRASSLVTIPTSAGPGSHVIRGKVIGVSRSASTTFTVTGPAIAAEPTATPSATPTKAAIATPTPTETPTIEPTIVETPIPEPTVEQSPTPEPTVDPGTPEPVETVTPEPTETPTPELTATEAAITQPTTGPEPTTESAAIRSLRIAALPQPRSRLV